MKQVAKLNCSRVGIVGTNLGKKVKLQRKYQQLNKSWKNK